jgi:23S rRNA pseudouridine1911/1915/1917 synthase
VRALIDDGHVLVEGRPAKPSRLLKGGEAISLFVPDPVAAGPSAEAIPLSILYEDAELIAVNKPSGMVVHPAAGVTSGTLVNALLHHCCDLQGIGGELRPGIVHRLDKDTSGCLVAAKTERALAALQVQFKRREAQKVYLAIVHGEPKEEGVFETLHGRHARDRKRFTGRVRTGKTAVTRYRVLERFDGAALVRVELVTGRTHQIRMHFSEAGHPLLGDILYGGVKREKRLAADSPVRRASEILGRQALHAQHLRLRHPVSGAPLDLEAPLPSEFQEALAVLGRGSRR